MSNTAALIVPVITIFEVFKVVLRESNENDALQAVAAMQKGKIIDLIANIAMNASSLSLHYNLPIADSIILATAEAHQRIIWTQDSDIQKFDGVRYFSK
jgi:predicted nucleic acid-binding protein